MSIQRAGFLVGAEPASLFSWICWSNVPLTLALARNGSPTPTPNPRLRWSPLSLSRFVLTFRNEDVVPYSACSSFGIRCRSESTKGVVEDQGFEVDASREWKVVPRRTGWRPQGRAKARF